MGAGKLLLLIFCVLTVNLSKSSLAQEYRLSKDVLPDLYDIHIKPYLRAEDGVKQFTFDGEVFITLHSVLDNIKEITLHKNLIDISEAILYDSNENIVEKLNNDALKYVAETNKLTIGLSKPLVENTNYTLYFKYHGQIRNGLEGFYRATYDNVNWYGITQLHRIDARTVFPCFDEPEFKAHFRMHINRPNQYNSVFNTRLEKATTDGTDRSIDHFEKTPLMSTYLVAFLISDFVSYGSEDLKIIMHSQFKGKLDFTYKVAEKAIEFYDNYTQMPYKTLGNEIMQKVGSNYFPHGGMENWGLVIYRDSALYHEPGYTDGWSDKQYTVSLVVHETGHMWFGNSVTHKWWSYFWLNEAFPTFYSYFLGHEMYPEYEFEQQFLLKELHTIFEMDATINTQPMTNSEISINNPTEIGSKFSNIAYSKGAAILRMFRNLMGKNNFDLAIREYLKEHFLKTSTPEDLFKYLKKYWPSTTLNLDEFFKDWTEQEGYPMVILTISPTGRFSVKQKRFLLDPSDGSNATLKYTIPITFNNDMMNDFNNLQPKFYLTKDQDERLFANANHHKWMIINTQQSNYYRVFYESQILREIGIILKANKHSGIHVNNRASIIDDLFTFARAGMKDYDELLEFMEYMATEVEYLPWQAAFKGFASVAQRLTLAQHNKFQEYLYEILNKVYEKLGFEQENETVLDVYNRNKVITWLCKYHHEDCNNKAQKIFLKHVAENTKPTPDFRETLYCSAVRNDRTDIYETLKNMFLKESIKSENEKLLRTMGCTRYFVKQHYEFILSNKVPNDLKQIALKALYSQTSENIIPVFHLMLDNVEQLKEGLQSWSNTAAIIADISTYLTTQEELNLLQQFTKDKGHLFGSSVSILDNAIKDTENNLKWSKSRLNKFINYLTLRNVEYRLPKEVIPDLYDIYLKPYLKQEDGEKQFTFEGQVNITLHAEVENLQKIILHSNYLDIKEAKLYNDNGELLETINSGSMLLETITHKLTVHLDTILETNKNYTLYFKYEGIIRNGTEGVFRVSYDNVNWYGITQLHRIDARSTFPSFDEPAFKAIFRMHITRPKDYNSVFNTRLIASTVEGSQYYTDHFEDSPLMSSYLVAFVISDFESYGNEDLKIIMHSKFKGKTDFAYEVGLKALQAYDNYTQMPYKTLGNSIMQKVGSPKFPHSGMENWGLVIYKDSVLAHEPGYTDGWSDKQYTVSLVVHETAHMWFGNSVTHKWWSYFWLNEAFARYYQFVMGHELYPEYELDKQFLNTQIHTIFDIDATNNSQPLTSLESIINTHEEIGEKFSPIAYSKGAAILRMFANLMGKTNFDLAIREYLKKYHLKSTEPQDLFECLKKYWPSGHNVNLDEFFRDWTEQVGYPVVNVTISPTGRFSVKQKRFLLDSTDGSDASLKYTIPITFNNDMMNDYNNLQPKFYLTKDQDERLFANANHHKWMIINTQQSNYYRVFYESKILKEIGVILKLNKHSGVHVNNRASIIDDLFTFARIGMKNYDELLEFMEYMATEVEYLPWQAAFKGFENVAQRFTLAQHDKFKDYLFDIMDKVYQKLGFAKSNDTVLDVYNRNKVISWLCKYHHEDCNAQAQKIVREHMLVKTRPTPDFRETIYCAAVRDDNTDIYDNLKEMFLTQTLNSEKEKILRALGCTSHFVKTHFEFLLSNKVELDLKALGLKSLYSQTPENINEVFELMLNNIDKLAESLQDWSATASLISDISQYLTTQEQLTALKQFNKDKGSLFGASISLLENSVKLIENNLKWSNLHLTKFMNYLTLRDINYRLPKDIIPDLYDIHIKPYLKTQDGSKQFTFDGEVNITLHALDKNLRKISLHKDYIDIIEAKLYDKEGNIVENITSGSMLYESLTDKLTVVLTHSLEVNTSYTLYFKYQGQIRAGLAGVFRATYDNVNWYGITQFQRIDARTAFPCFDEPEFKAKFRMHISRPNDYNSYFNTRLIESTIEGTDRIIDHFEESPLMSTYLVAFLISDYESYGNEDLKLIMHPKFKNKINFTYEAALKILQAYDSYTQLPYKTLGNTLMQKAGSPRFPHNGMENWGLLIYHDSVLAHEPGYTDGWSDKEYTITILAHETSHMWFGNSVTFKWWSYFWLNEAFARYYQYFLAHEVYPEYELDKQFPVKQVQLIFGVDATNNTQPLSNPEETINTPADLGYKFSGITYAKGAAIVRMFANLMGKENFDQAIREYLKEHHLKNTEPQDLFKYLKKHWPKTHMVDLDVFFKDWTEQVGYPLVTVSASPSGRFALTQKRFLLDPNDGSDASLRYTIPITFNNDMRTNYSDLTPRFFFNKTQEVVEFGMIAHHDWIVFNTQQSNYYRVMYEGDLEKKLRIALEQEHHSGIHVTNRASIVDDLFTFAKIGLRGYDELLEFMEYLATETEYSPWYAAFKGFDDLYPRMTLVQHDRFANYLMDILEKVYHKLGFENPNDTVLDVYNRNKVISWLCRYHHKDCNTQAQKLFREHLLQNTKPTTDFRETLYCAAVREGHPDIYGHLKTMFLEQDLSSEKEKILRAMGCTLNSVNEHYNLILSANVSLGLKTSALKALYSQSPENIMPVFKLMTENIEQLQEALQSWSTTANVISEISNYLTTQEQLALLKQFTTDKGSLFGSSVSILENSVKTTENNLKWSSLHLTKLIRYLSDRKSEYRLPKDVLPEHYDIYIKPYLQSEDGDKQFTFEGEVNITLFAAEKNTRKITLHKNLLDIEEIVLYNSKGNVVEKIQDEQMLYETITNKFTVYLSQPMTEFLAYTLYIKYKGQIRTGAAGFFRATYDNNSWYGLTQFEQIDARTAFPCFDEPDFKAKFRMRINRPKEYNSHFNTRLVESCSDGNGRYIDTFEDSPIMSTYLVAFMVTDFDSFGYRDFKIIMHTKFNGKTNFAYEAGQKLLEAYDAYTQQPYKSMGNSIMQKTGIRPFPYGGMENWGLVIYNEQVLVHEPGYTDGWSDKQYTLTTVSHETSHMWFGDSVTCKWWSYFWLNEGFARYYGYMMTHEVYPEYELDKQFLLTQVQTIFATDATNKTQPMTTPEELINTPSEISYKFSSITYAKGASIVRMFSNLMGKENFEQAIRDYLRENHLRNTVPEDLFKHLKKHWPKSHMVDLDELFKDWTEQVGYPVVTVSASPNGRFSLKQKRFLYNSTDGSDASLRYTIPITFNNDMRNNYSDFTPRFYFNKTLEEVQFGMTAHHDWVVVNTQQSNFYRVLYETELQKQLRIALEQTNHSDIHVNNRAAVIDDLFAFAQAGLKEYDEVFEFMEYLATETEYSPWYAAFKGFNTIYVRMTLEQHKEFGLFLHEILEKVYQKLGFENPDVSILDIYNRNRIINWQCRYHHVVCNNHAQHIFLEHLKANTKPIPDFRETLYCAACRNDQTEIYGHLKNMFNQEERLSEKEKIVRAMGCTRYNVEGHYKFILTTNVPQNLKTTALNALYSQTPENIDTVFKLMTENVEELNEALQSWSTTASVISGISNYLSTQEQLNTLQRFTEEKGHLFGNSVITLQNAVKTTENNLQWSSVHLTKIFNYLSQRKNSAATTSVALFVIPLTWLTLQILM